MFLVETLLFLKQNLDTALSGKCSFESFSKYSRKIDAVFSRAEVDTRAQISWRKS